MEPIGSFKNVNFSEWEKGFKLNFTQPLKLLKMLLPFANLSKEKPLVIFISGAGTNNAPKNFSSYVLSKIALIKATEILDAEFKDFRFSIFGTGWIKSDIHLQVLNSSDQAKEAFLETKRRFENNDFTSIKTVENFMNWLIKQDKKIIGGRNFSSRDDDYLSKELTINLFKNNDLFKLRRNNY